MTRAVRSRSGVVAPARPRLAGSPPATRTMKPSNAVQKEQAIQPKLMVNRTKIDTVTALKPPAPMISTINAVAIAVEQATSPANTLRRMNLEYWWSDISLLLAGRERATQGFIQPTIEMSTSP